VWSVTVVDLFLPRVGAPTIRTDTHLISQLAEKICTDTTLITANWPWVDVNSVSVHCVVFVPPFRHSKLNHLLKQVTFVVLLGADFRLA
jgi:hypothetical protein